MSTLVFEFRTPRPQEGHVPGGRLTLSELAGSRQSPKPIERVPFQLYPPNGKMTRSDLDRPSHNLAICPNKLERHEPPSPQKVSPATAAP